MSPWPCAPAPAPPPGPAPRPTALSPHCRTCPPSLRASWRGLPRGPGVHTAPAPLRWRPGPLLSVPTPLSGPGSGLGSGLAVSGWSAHTLGSQWAPMALPVRQFFHIMPRTGLSRAHGREISLHLAMASGHLGSASASSGSS